MKLHSCLLPLMLAVAGTVQAGGDHHHGAQRGGVVAPGKDWDFELVARATSIQLYVSDHGQPADVSKASARITLLTGTDKQEVELRPAGDKLEATGTFQVGTGTKAVAVVTMNGKPATARFTLK